ncbi:MAG: O-antigen ligase family protein [bacterium]
MSAPARPLVPPLRGADRARPGVGRGVLLALLLVTAGFLGLFMDATTLVMALGLCNIAVVVFLLLKRDITWGFLFYLTTVIFFQTGFWIRLHSFPDLYPGRVSSILLFLVFLIQIIVGMRKVPPLGVIEKSMVVFVVLMFISIITTGQRPAWLLLMRGYIYPFLFFYFARAVVNREDQLKLVFAYLVTVGIYFAVMGIFEKLKWYALVWPRFIVDATVAEHGLMRLGFRVRGIFLQPAVLGTVMTMGFFPAWHWLNQRKGIVVMVIRIVLLLTTPATLFFTETRSVYLGFLFALIIASVWGRGLRVVSIGILLAGATGAFLNWDNLGTQDRNKGGLATMNTIQYRVELAYETAEIFVDHPFFGVGFQNFDEAAIRYRKPRDVPVIGHVDIGVGGQSISHNILETIVAEQGAAGLVPFVLVFVLVILRSLRAYHALPRQGLISKDYVVCVWCGIAAYLTNAMFLEMRYFEYVNVLFFFLLGAMVGMQEAVEADRMQLDVPVEAAPVSPWAGTVAVGGRA